MAIKMANNNNIKKRIYTYTVIHSSNMRNTCVSLWNPIGWWV